jgi:hypothetical protein
MATTLVAMVECFEQDSLGFLDGEVMWHSQLMTDDF